MSIDKYSDTYTSVVKYTCIDKYMTSHHFQNRNISQEKLKTKKKSSNILSNVMRDTPLPCPHPLQQPLVRKDVNAFKPTEIH